ncbi:brain acid soluble protein 1 homolog isoform X2 [Oryctolagus cuniculus]|uniref:brain acid soluble protein 1 homolog isoform X2 n=1 Tax=Oryctolagus cuniculus TaxID=9986 RepID=UPI002230CA27|nr:brain acid soluble protein 1 [Oryctolagus cuniculus]
MLEATLPFGGKDLEELQDRVLCGSYVVPRGISPALQELLAWLLTVDASGRPSAEDASTHSWFSLSREAAQEHEEGAVTPLQPLGVPRDLEAREYLAGLGLLPGTGTEGTPGPQPQDPASLPKSSQNSKFPPIEDDGLALVSCDSMAVNVSSAQSDSSEAPSQPQQERSPAPSAAPDSSKPSSQPQQERSPAPSAAPQPASKASPSSPNARSRVDLAEPEAAAAAREPEGAGTAATADTTDSTASAQDKRQGRHGVGRRILRFLPRACCILPS